MRIGGGRGKGEGMEGGREGGVEALFRGGREDRIRTYQVKGMGSSTLQRRDPVHGRGDSNESIVSFFDHVKTTKNKKQKKGSKLQHWCTCNCDCMRGR